MRWIGRRLTYANVLSTAAIFAVLGAARSPRRRSAPGTAPDAAPGTLCVYFGRVSQGADPGETLVFDPSDAEFDEDDEAGRFGAVVAIGADDNLGGGAFIANGTWAVTAP